MKHHAVTPLNPVSLLQRWVTFDLNERILKLRKSTRPCGTKADKTAFLHLLTVPAELVVRPRILESSILPRAGLGEGSEAHSAVFPT